MDIKKLIRWNWAPLKRWIGRLPTVKIAVGVVILAQSIAIGWRVVESEWILSRGITVRLAIEAEDPYDPIRGNYFSFIPNVFRHSFKSSLPIVAGDRVWVGTVDSKQSQWAILDSVPTTNVPYYRVVVKSSNHQQFFLSPPFRRIYLNDDAKAAVLKAVSMPKGRRIPIFLIVKHSGNRSIISGIQVGPQYFFQN